MIKFTDGTEISQEEAAHLIEAEGRLIRNLWCNSKNERCVTGVIEDWHHDGLLVKSQRVMIFDPLCKIQKINDAFEGTPEERAVYMAAWLRMQEGT